MCLYVFQVQLCMFLMDMAGTLAAAFTEGGLGAGGGQSFARGGGGSGTQKVQRSVYQKQSKSIYLFLQIAFFPKMKSGSKGGRGVSPPPPPPQPRRRC